MLCNLAFIVSFNILYTPLAGGTNFKCDWGKAYEISIQYIVCYFIGVESKEIGYVRGSQNFNPALSEPL